MKNELSAATLDHDFAEVVPPYASFLLRAVRPARDGRLDGAAEPLVSLLCNDGADDSVDWFEAMLAADSDLSVAVAAC